MLREDDCVANLCHPSPLLPSRNVLRSQRCQGISGNVGALVVGRRHWGIIGASAAVRWHDVSCWGRAVARWRGDGDVRVFVLACCCRRRGEDATINIRWEVGGERMAKGGYKVEVVRGGAIATVPPFIASLPTIAIAPLPSIAIAPPVITPPPPSIAIVASANH